ncbi:hypothetical protein ACFH1K_11500, partial [Citrobacter farmeri]|uniref:hypothetical protein n=1 Tax=Citrobacter farmeri TaxID=67824 RepID=UPI00361447FF
MMPGLSTEHFVLFDYSEHPCLPLQAVASQLPANLSCPQRVAQRLITDKTKGLIFRPGLLFYLMSGSSLLSHGETPHYHRRYGVSLLSSA